MKKIGAVMGTCAATMAMLLFSGCASMDVAGDEEKAAHVAELIDAIYVQSWTDKTDAQCAEAKAAWDALTDAQKELVCGEYSDPDYFGRDTGDASKDNPLNQDGIGEKEILVVSFGTSFNDSRVADIKSIEDAVQTANPDWSVRRAFTSQIIINHIQARDDERIDNVEQALERAVANGVRQLVIQPTHLMHGAEYDQLVDAVKAYAASFESVLVAEPLLGSVGDNASSVNQDKRLVAQEVTAEAVKAAGFASLSDAEKSGTAFVFMGHGTAHVAKVSYSQMAAQMAELGYDNVFIGTVEGEPEETACENIIEAIVAAGYKNIVLRPLMVVAGDHANNDMAGDDEDSWKSMFEASGAFDSISCQVAGLGRIPAIQALYVGHTKNASTKVVASAQGGALVLADGTYTARFNSDSSMFRVNDAFGGFGVLTVANGKMTLHISLTGKSILNLYLGKAEDAESNKSDWLQPTVDVVTYSDGTTEEVFGFDVPVDELNKDFALALIGKKGVWYDHWVSVSDVTVR